jgi:CO dehydrogenase maturation factor
MTADATRRPRTAPLKIAVAGKGGAGKSLLTGTMARILARDHRVLVVDLDVLPGVTLTLGKSEPSRATPGGAPFERLVDRLTTPAPDGIRVLPGATYASQGKVGPLLSMWPGLADASSRLARGRALRSWTILGDLPAGPRPAAYRQYVAYADVLLVVAEPTLQSILTARRLVRLGRSRPELTVHIVGNKVADAEDGRRLADGLGARVVATIPFDEDVRAAERRGEAVIDHFPAAAAVVAIERLVDALQRDVTIAAPDG